MPSPLDAGPITVTIWREGPERTLHLSARDHTDKEIDHVAGGSFKEMVTNLLISVDPAAAVDFGADPKLVLERVLGRQPDE